MTEPISRRAFAAGVAVLPLAAFGQRAAAPAGGEWIVHTDVPPNREVPLADLIRKWITPVDRFYVRSHAASPAVDADAYRLTVDGLVERPLSLSLAELSDRFESVKAVCTMTCAGNRRTEHSRTRQISGVPWQAGAIGNAAWGGVRLSDVLTAAGVREGARHVWFDGLDEIERPEGAIGFGASIPVEKAMSEEAGLPGAVVCTTMNGEPLTADHGFPVRTVVPGYIGARSVKWLGRIRVSDRPNPNHYQATAYKVVTEATPIEWAEKAPIYRFPLNAVICTPAAGAGVAAGRVEVAGYALPPGEPGVRVGRVEVSGDGGATWTKAALTGEQRPMCWTLWKASVPVEADARSLLVRATDTRGRGQPRTAPWNKKGYLYNGWHRVPVEAS